MKFCIQINGRKKRAVFDRIFLEYFSKFSLGMGFFIQILVWKKMRAIFDRNS